MLEKNKQNNNIYKLKIQSKEYKKELQKFLDKAENIENEDLRFEVICQMLKCDKVLTKIAEQKIQEISIKNP